MHSRPPRVDITASVSVRWLRADRGLNVASDLTIASQLNADSTWQAGRLAGMLSITAGTTLTIGAGGTLQLAPGAALVNDGTFHFDFTYGTYGGVYFGTLQLDCDPATGGDPASILNKSTIELNTHSAIVPNQCVATSCPF